jgi:hypothetical protein
LLALLLQGQGLAGRRRAAAFSRCRDILQDLRNAEYSFFELKFINELRRKNLGNLMALLPGLDRDTVTDPAFLAPFLDSCL